MLQGVILIDDFIKSAYSPDGKRFNGKWWMPVNRFNEENSHLADLAFKDWSILLKEKCLYE